MNPVKIAIGFAPFVLVTLLTGRVAVGWAAVIGLVTALGVVAVTARGGIKVLPVVQAVILLTLAVAAFRGGPAVAAFLVLYGRGLASFALGLFILATATSTPFTAQFARTAVPESEWHSALFLRINRRLSLAWGVVVLVVGACHMVGAYLGVQQVQPLIRLLVDWAVPVFAFVRVIGYTREVAARKAPLLPDRDTSVGRNESCPRPSILR